MAITISTSPTFALPGIETRIIVSGAIEDTQRVKIKTAPRGSEYYRNDGTEVALPTVLDYRGRTGQETIVFKPDVSGKYTLVVEDIDQFPNRKASYQGSPNDNHQETISSRTEVSLYVSAKLTLDIGAGTDLATLVMWINNSACHATLTEEYGSDVGDSPRLENPTSFRADQAMQALTNHVPADLVGESSSSMIGDIPVLINDWSDRFAQHMNDSAGIHAGTTDLPNAAIASQAKSYPTTTKAQIEALNKLNQALVSHMSNARDGYESHSEPDHDLPVIGGCSDARTAILMMADLYRVAQDHWAQVSNPSAHTGSDATNSLQVPGVLLLMIGEFLEYIGQQNPSGASTVNPGAAELVASCGFASEFSPGISVT